MKTKYYKHFSNLNFIKSKRLNNVIGLGFFKWVVKNTFFKYLNQKLKLTNKTKLIELEELKKEMTVSEISHLIGFVFATIFVLISLISSRYLLGVMIMTFNKLLNLYPTLLQQQNKRRIDQLLQRYS